MKAITFLTFLIICLFGCNSSSSSTVTKEVNDQSTSSLKLKELKIQVIDEWPSEIEGCSCYFSLNENGFKNTQYIFISDYQELAFMKINGQLERFKLAEPESETFSGKMIEIWKSDNFELILETHQLGQVDETWQYKGILTLKSKDGANIDQEIYGECGC